MPIILFESAFLSVIMMVVNLLNGGNLTVRKVEALFFRDLDGYQ